MRSEEHIDYRASADLPIVIEADLTDFSHDKTELIKSLFAAFEDIFSSSNFDLDCTNLVHQNMEINSSKPIPERLRRLAVHVQVKLQEMIDDMFKCDIIQLSQSP